jgi:hypothetical protein
MSCVDVDAIKRFAAEEDAFSLIISASRTADSDNLAMHYCTNVRGQKYIISDIPVETCYSQERLDMGSKMADMLIEELGNSLTEKDRKAILSKCATFAASELPDMFESDLKELTDYIKDDVKKLVKSDTFSSYRGGGRRWEKDKSGMWVEAKDIFGFGGGGGSSHRDYHTYDDSYDGNYEWYEQAQQAEEHSKLVKIANGVNPVTGNRDVSKTQQKKAKKRLVKIAARERTRSEKRKTNLKEDNTVVKVGDYVLILDDPETIASVEAQCETVEEQELADAMLVAPSPIESINGDLITVNGIQFWHDELRLATKDEIDLVNAEQLEMVI